MSDVLIVASSASARSELKGLCVELEHVRIVGAVGSGSAAVEAAETLHPDLLLLDSPLADMTDRELLWQLPAHCRHAVVSVTADAHDIPLSLTLGSAECLTRPLSSLALSTALVRAQARARSVLRDAGGPGEHDGSDRPTSQIGSFAPPVLVGEREHRLYLLDPRRVDYVASADNYVRFRTGKLEYIARDTVKRLYPSLHPLGFVRIDRSVLLNIASIAYVQPLGRGIFVFALGSGERLRSSPGYRESILDVLPLRRRTATRTGRVRGSVPERAACLREPRDSGVPK